MQKGLWGRTEQQPLSGAWGQDLASSFSISNPMPGIRVLLYSTQQFGDGSGYVYNRTGWSLDKSSERKPKRKAGPHAPTGQSLMTLRECSRHAWASANSLTWSCLCLLSPGSKMGSAKPLLVLCVRVIFNHSDSQALFLLLTPWKKTKQNPLKHRGF